MCVSALISWPVQCLHGIIMGAPTSYQELVCPFLLFSPFVNLTVEVFFFCDVLSFEHSTLLVVSLLFFISSSWVFPESRACGVWGCVQKVCFGDRYQGIGVNRVSKEGGNVLPTAAGNLSFIGLILVDKWMQTLQCYPPEQQKREAFSFHFLWTEGFLLRLTCQHVDIMHLWAPHGSPCPKGVRDTSLSAVSCIYF